MTETTEVGTDWQSIAERDPKKVAAELDRLYAVERAARDLIKTGIRTTPDGMIIREAADKSDPHYKLCAALEAIEPLNGPSNLAKAVKAARGGDAPVPFRGFA